MSERPDTRPTAAGTRIKLLEALAHGRPVVSTAVGAAGLDLAPGRDGLLVADDPHGFADACRRLLEDPALASRLAAAGREVVAVQASVDVVGDQIAGLFSHLVAGSPLAEGQEPAAALASRARFNMLAAEVCRRLEDAGVDVILLKGASFAAWLYHSAVDRSFGDIDLLMDPADERVASEVLAGLGFARLLGRSKAMAVGRPAVVWRRGHDMVDLHRGRFWGIGVPADAGWTILRERTERMRIGGAEVKVLDAAARSVHVAVHAVASGPTASRQREDLRRAVAQLALEVWEQAAGLAAALGASSSFAAGLGLTADGRALAARLALDDSHSLESALFVAGPPPLSDGLTRLRDLPGAWPKVASVARTVVPTPSYLRFQVPWSARTRLHTVLAYPAWLAMVARSAGPAVGAVRRASRMAGEAGGNRAGRR